MKLWHNAERLGANDTAVSSSPGSPGWLSNPLGKPVARANGFAVNILGALPVGPASAPEVCKQQTAAAVAARTVIVFMCLPCDSARRWQQRMTYNCGG